MIRSFLLLAIVAASLAACASAKDVAVHNEERCKARGLEPNTKNYEDCIRQLENDRDTRMEQSRRRMLEQSAVPPSNRGY